MGMATLQFYQNKYNYPHYSSSLTSYGTSLECTPVGLNLRTGTLRVKGNMSDFMSCNYLALTRDGQTLYAWIDDVQFRTDDSFEVVYSVDAWRTYKNKIDLGVQYIDRRPEATSQRDPLLGSEQDYPDISSKLIWKTPNTNSRIFVVQVRPKGGALSSSPVQPSPYQFWMVAYDASDWMSSTPLVQLVGSLGDGAETENLVTMYSIPYMDISGLPVPTQGLPVETPSGSTSVEGFSLLTDHSNVTSLLYRETPITIDENKEELLRVNHSVQLVIPDGGIIDIPDALLMKDNLLLREDVDLFSGASNFMLSSGTSGTDYYTQSVRGSSVSSIPILSDPMDTYMSQNQNALTTSLLGDIATMVGSAALLTPQGRAVGAAAGLTGGMSSGAGLVGLYSGVNSMIDRKASIQDAGSRYSNPPAFLGTALAGRFNNRCWVVVTKDPVDNASDVHTNYGYQYGKVTNLSLPSSGFIKTEGCNVMSTDGSVPRWALNEINTIFDNGIQVH